ncbi:hypothetical protein ABPG72_001328 [Tetrahymena utriculariae]
MLNVLIEYPNGQPISNMQEGLYDAGSLDVPQGSQQQSSQNYYLSNINAQSSQIVNQNNYQYFQIQQYSSIHNGNTEDEKFQFFSTMSNLNNTHNEQHSQNQVNTQFDEQQLFNQSSNNLANGCPLEDNYLDQFLNNQETGQKQLFTNMLQQDYENKYEYQNDFFNQNTLQQCLLDYKEVNQYYFDQDNQLNFKEGCFQPKESDTQQTNYENQIASSNSIVDPAKNSLKHHQKNLNITIENLEVRASEQNISNEEIKSLNLFSYCQNNTKAQAEIINNQEIKECHNNFGDLPPNNISGVSESYDQKYNFINNCIHKKNVVKNIMNQFKSFVFTNKECNSEIDSTKKGFQKNLKSSFSQEEIMSKNQQIVQLYSQFKQKQETLQQIQMKFQRYIKLKSSNNYNLILLIQHQQYKFIFKYFLNNYAKLQLQRRKIKNIDSHIQFIDFLLDSFSNPEILSILKKHDKKKPVYS